MRLSLHSGIRVSGLRKANNERQLKRSVLITEGEWKGWRAYGPYFQKATSNRSAREYYQLKNAEGLRRNVDVDAIDITGLAEEKILNDKPFLDFIR